MARLSGRRVLVMATSGFEEEELFGPRRLLLADGAAVVLAAPTRAPIQATVLDDPGRTIRPDLAISDADPAAFDALILPGGVINPDALRMNGEAIRLIRAFAEAEKPVAAICHGPWLLIEADLVRGRRVTGWPSIRTDLRNAGGILVDDEVVVDGSIVTARCPDDVRKFTEAVAAMLTVRA